MKKVDWSKLPQMVKHRTKKIYLYAVEDKGESFKGIDFIFHNGILKHAVGITMSKDEFEPFEFVN